MQISNQQKKEDIREAQIYLRVIAENDPDIPMVVPDGVFGKETEDAVRAFQKKYGLSVTGKIDAATWELLYKEYLKAAQNFAPLQAITPLTRNNIPLTEGDAGYLIYIVQAMINTVAQFYDNIEGPPVNGVYDNATAESVKQLQQVMGTEQTGIIDAAAWNSLARLYNFHSAIDEKDTITPPQSAPEETQPVLAVLNSVG
ncbi:MAG: peptidoglycan-binding protein [Oscillospiraceae bacterium]|nr:peptidoglycan-binding protein [Oscillospiraceae bacterium]